MKGRWYYILYFVPVILATGAAIWRTSLTWVPVEAVVESTAIRKTRPGTPAWSIIATINYEAEGKSFRKEHVDVFHDADRAVTEAEKGKWPLGRGFTVYYQQNNPARYSLLPDGNAEVWVVLTVLFCIAYFLVLLPFYIASRR
ncbi:MAG: DUF3592 domain-containing protein [Verrucomicrobiales bacterium]|nr:DUF3592 domain-containing protein [Verrucomicrobiales bacterium]